MSDESQVFQVYVQSMLHDSFFLGAKNMFNCLILQAFTFTWVLFCLNVA